jgi:hypothetical protein
MFERTLSEKLCKLIYSDTQSFLKFLRILDQLEMGVFNRAVELKSPCTYTLC